MNTGDNNQKPSVNPEQPPGSEPERITPETPVCPTKKVPCNYWTDDGCQVAVCWMKERRKKAKAA